MAEGDETLLAMETVEVFTFEHRVIKHLRGADEVDAVLPHVLLAARFFPLEHERLYARCRLLRL